MEPKLHISGRLLEEEKKVEVGVVHSHLGLWKVIAVVYSFEFETDRVSTCQVQRSETDPP